MHPSKSTTVPVIVFIVLLCDLPLPSTTTSTRSPRSCHRPVAGDRAALPASMTRRPAVVAGPVDSAGTPHTAYTTGGQASAPCQHSCRNPTRHWPTRASVAGKTSSQSKFDPHTLEEVSFARQGCSAWVGSRSRGRDYSKGGTSSRRRRARPPHTRGMISAIAIGAPTTDLVVKTKLALHQGCLQQHQGTWSCLVRERTLRQGCRQQHQDGTWSSQVPERLPGLTCGGCPLVAKSLVCPIGMLSAC